MCMFYDTCKFNSVPAFTQGGKLRHNFLHRLTLLITENPPPSPKSTFWLNNVTKQLDQLTCFGKNNSIESKLIESMTSQNLDLSMFKNSSPLSRKKTHMTDFKERKDMVGMVIGELRFLPSLIFLEKNRWLNLNTTEIWLSWWLVNFKYLPGLKDLFSRICFHNHYLPWYFSLRV